MRLDAFLKFEKGPEGESTDALHQNEIEILTFEQSAEMLRQKEGESLRTRMFELSVMTILKPLDKTSPKLLEAVAARTQFPKAKICACRWIGSSKDTPDSWKKIDYFTIELTDVYVARIQLLGDARVQTIGGDRIHRFYPDDLTSIGPLEQVDLNYKTVKWSYKGMDGKKGVISIPITKESQG
jgi:type VI secretion system Hcp family effector